MTPIIIDYHFEVYQKLKINVYDNDDVIGSGECTLAELLTTSGQCFRTELKHKSKKTGVVYIVQTFCLKIRQRIYGFFKYLSF